MSLKENMTMVREELSSEEQFFESAVKAERFVKRYKKPLIGLLVLIVLGVGAAALFEAKKQADIEAANAALLTLQKNGDDAAAAAELQQRSPALFEAWQLSSALAKGDVAALETLGASQVASVADLAAYHKAVLSEDAAALEAYTLKPDAIYRDYALLQLGVLLLREGRTQEAHQKLQMIPEDSMLSRYVQPLMHYGAK